MSGVSEVKMVLDFLRRNGLTEVESALKLDLKEKNEVDVVAFESFLFPMLPPVRISTNAPPRGEGLVFDVGECSKLKSASEDEFMSLDSSTSNDSSSEFTNPYGVRSGVEVDSGVDVESDSSSDRLSAFDTARDYHDLDSVNGLHWFDDRDESHFMTPCYNGSGPFGVPTEDKFIMSSNGSKQQVKSHVSCYEVEHGTISKCDNEVEPLFVEFKSVKDGNGVLHTNSYQYDETLMLKDDIFIGGIDDSGQLFQDTIRSVVFDRKSPSLCGSPQSDTEQDDFGEFMIDIYTDSTLLQTEVRSPLLDRKPSDASNEFGTTSKEIHKSDYHGRESLEKEIDTHVVEESSDTSKLDNQENTASKELIQYDNPVEEYEVFYLKIIHRKNRTGFEENKEFPVILNTMVAGRYYFTEYLGSAAFSKVVEAQDLFTGMHVCLKIVKNDKDLFDQSLDEIKLLKYVNKHDPRDEHHILRLYDYFYHQEHLFIVCELLRANLYEFQKFNKESGADVYFTLPRLQVIARQCLEALEFLHQLGIIHCDLKPENMLIKSYKRAEIKIIDLGSSCFVTDNLCLYVQSRSYRAPEVTLGCPYDQKIDIWSLGCILAELFSGEVLFPNESLVMLLARIIGILGPFDMEMLEMGKDAHKYFTNECDLYYVNEETKQLQYITTEESSLEHHLQTSDDMFLDFLTSLLETNPQRRLTAKDALHHPWLAHHYDL